LLLVIPAKKEAIHMPHLHFTYLVVIRWSARERAFIAKAPGLSGCVGTGDTYQAALNSCLEAMQWRAEQAEQRRQPLPPAEFSWSHHTASEEAKQSAVL
jgi:predicted RNase H-like HicB family nuclease